MSKVADVLNRYKAVSEGKVDHKNEEQQVGQGGASLRGIIEKLIKENYGKDNDTQKEMVDEMKKLAESDEKEANSFMKHMDEMASKYEMKHKDEQFDGSDNKGAKDADDEDEEEGAHKKTGKDSPDFGGKKKDKSKK